MINKIVFISYLPLTQKVYSDFFMSELECAGIDVVYLDVTSIFHDLSSYENYNSNVVVKVSDYTEFRNYIGQQSKKTTLFVNQITYNWTAIKLFRILTIEKCLLGRFTNGMLPLMPLGKRLQSTHFSIFDINKYIRFLKYRTSAILKYCGYIKPHDIIFNAGDSGYATIGAGYNIDKQNGEIVQINSIDYEYFLQKRYVEEKAVKGKYIVFIDQYLPFHPDLKITGIKPLDPTKYYSELNEFFKSIEEQFNIPVVIAAHPKALKYKEYNYFGGRHIIWNDTGSLVRDCEFVLGHNSTSCSFAILFNKPVTFISSNQLIKEMPDLHNSSRYFAEIFKSNFILYDEPISKEIFKSIDTVAYNNYKYQYVTSLDSEYKRSLDIILSYLKNYSIS